MSAPAYLVSQLIGASKITASNPPAPPSTLPDGQLVYFKGVGYKYAEGGILISIGGGGGTSAGPVNTPGYGAAVINAGLQPSSIPDWNTTATWGPNNPTSLIRAAAAAGNSQLHGIVATGAVDGNIAVFFNTSTTDSFVTNNESATCVTATDRLLTPNLAQGVIPPQGTAVFRRDGTLNRWTRFS